MIRADRQERRRIRREQVAQVRAALQEERQAAWELRAGRRIFQWRGRRGDAVEVRFDSTNAIVVPFNPQCDHVEDVAAKVAFQQMLSRQGADDPPN